MARCSECGYLGLRNMLNGSLEESQEPFIPNSVIKTMAGMTGAARYQLPPICAKGLTLFRNGAEAQLLVEIGMERQCAGFMQRLAGSTPKEHRQIEMEQFLRDEAARREKDQRDWQAAQNAANRRFSFQSSIATTLLGFLLGLASLWIGSRLISKTPTESPPAASKPATQP